MANNDRAARPGCGPRGDRDGIHDCAVQAMIDPAQFDPSLDRNAGHRGPVGVTGGQRGSCPGASPHHERMNQPPGKREILVARRASAAHPDLRHHQQRRPVGFRTVLFRLAVQVVTERQAVPEQAAAGTGA
jgi:hypothetical protein